MKRKRNQMKPDYDDYRNMIYFWANRSSKKFTLPLDEVISLNNLIFCEAMKEWKPERSSFSTYLTIKLNLSQRRPFLPAFSGFSGKSEMERMKSSISSHLFVELTEEGLLPHPDSNPFRATTLKEAITKLSPAGRRITSLVLDPKEAPLLITEGRDTARKTRAAIRNRLKEEGWPSQEVTVGMREVKRMVRYLSNEQTRIRRGRNDGKSEKNSELYL